MASEPSSLRLPEPCSLDEISDVFLYYWQENVNNDVSFAVKCGDGWIDFTAHKLIISIFSPVFADMCYDPVDPQNTIRIEDVSPAIFEAMLQFMYGSLLNRQFNDISFTLKLYKAAIAYEVEALKTACNDVFRFSKPDKNNVFQLLDAAKLLGSENLLQRCYKVLQTQTAEVLSSQDLYNVTPAMLLTILDMPRVSFSSEYELVVWVFAWAKNQCLKVANDKSLREVLEEFLPYLNLTRLTAQEFGKLYQNHTDFISESEGFSIFMNIANPDSWPLPAWCPVAPKKRLYRNQISAENKGQPSVSKLQEIIITTPGVNAENNENVLHLNKEQPTTSNSSSSNISVSNKDSDTNNPSTLQKCDVTNKDSDTKHSVDSDASSKDSDSSDSDISDEDSDNKDSISEMLCSKKLVDFVLAKLIENPDNAEAIISFPEVLKSAAELLVKEDTESDLQESDAINGTESANKETEHRSENSKST